MNKLYLSPAFSPEPGAGSGTTCPACAPGAGALPGSPAPELSRPAGGLPVITRPGSGLALPGSGSPAPAGAGACPGSGICPGSGSGEKIFQHSEKNESEMKKMYPIINDSDGWHGINRNKWNNEKELKELILADCKRAKIPVSIRFGRGGYTTRMTVTIKISPDDIVSLSEYRPALYPNSSCMVKDETGRVYYKRYSDLSELPPAERLQTIRDARRYDYEYTASAIQSPGTILPEKMLQAILRPATYDTLKAVRRIVSSYNSDHSDIMTDYFDRAIYDVYCFKITPAK